MGDVPDVALAEISIGARQEILIRLFDMKIGYLRPEDTPFQGSFLSKSYTYRGPTPLLSARANSDAVGNLVARMHDHALPAFNAAGYFCFQPVAAPHGYIAKFSTAA